MEQSSAYAVSPNRDVLVRVMNLVKERGSGSPLVDTGNLLASVCVVAAVLHPEWAAAVFFQSSSEVRLLAEDLVRLTGVDLVV